VLAQLSALKVGIGGIWEAPTPATARQAASAKAALVQAVAETNAFLSKAVTVSEALKAQDITISVPPPIR